MEMEYAKSKKEITEIGTKKKIRKYLKENLIGADKIVLKKDFTFELKQGYFYTNGQTSEKFASEMKIEIEKLGYKVIVINDTQTFVSWPGTSYFIAILAIS